MQHLCLDISFPHGFLSADGGVSTGVYNSLNCGPGSDDAPDAIRENRRIAAEIISGDKNTPLSTLYQIHSPEVVTLTAPIGSERPKADAIVTKERGLLIGILTPDCTPVLFADRENQVVGAAHAGWKGALYGVLENTLTAMEMLGAKRGHITAAIGPTIHQPSYEVSADFLATFLEHDTDAAQHFIPGKDDQHFQFNLPGFVTKRLKEAGVGQVWDCGIDTYTSGSHFSYRRTTHRKEPDYGRQVSAIMLP